MSLRDDRDKHFRCGICTSAESSGVYAAREMMFGLRTSFHYAQCASCGTLWLTDSPADLSSYYPGNYYSLSFESASAVTRLKRFLISSRDRSYFGSPNLIGRLLARFYPEGMLFAVSKLKLDVTARILDIGCGRGELLRRMAALKFKNLIGVDPFVPGNISYGDNARVLKATVEDMDAESFDLVMFHHSLEHVGNPGNTLRSAVRLLHREGQCLVRIPVVSYAWTKYGTNWVQLDPPRHVWLPTEHSMKTLGESVGLVLENVEYDSTSFQFWGSELYSRDVPLQSANRRTVGSYLRRALNDEYRDTAVALNRRGQGDQAAFLFRKF